MGLFYPTLSPTRTTPLPRLLARVDMAGAATKKAKEAASAARAGPIKSNKQKIYTKPSSKRPKTLELPRKPKYPRRSTLRSRGLDKHSIIVNPLTTEAAMKEIENHNTLVFIVSRKANKPQVKLAVKELYDVKVVKVNTLIRPDGRKKAFVRLSPDHDAVEVANKIGIV